MARKHLKALRLKENLRSKIDGFRCAKFQPHQIGIHMRRTDMVCSGWAKIPKYHLITNAQVGKIDALAMRLLEEHATPGTCFFLACDDLLYQEKIRKMLEESHCTVAIYGKKDPKGLRQTSLQDAICDLYLLAHCEKILRCGPSGFSRLASQIGDTPMISVKTRPEWYARIQIRYGLLRNTIWFRRPWTAFIENMMPR